MEGVLIEKFVGRLLGNVFFGQKFFPGFLRSGHEWCPKTFYHIIPGEEVFRGISDFRTREEKKKKYTGKSTSLLSLLLFLRSLLFSSLFVGKESLTKTKRGRTIDNFNSRCLLY